MIEKYGTKKAYLGIDQGSTATKVLLVSSRGTLLFVSRKGVKTRVSGRGVYQDPNALLRSVRSAISETVAFSRERGIRIAGAGVATQRSSFLFFDGRGRPLTPIVSWRDTSCADRIPPLLPRKETIKKISGLPLTPYYSALKLKKYIPSGRSSIFFGTVNTFLIFALTKGGVFATDPASAQRTLLFDIHTLNYSEELLRCFSVPKKVRFPEVRDSVADYGDILLRGEKIPILSSTGDQQAAFFASSGWETGRGLINLGTGGFLLVPVKEIPERLGNLIVTLSHTIEGTSFFLLEGTVNSVSDALLHFEGLLGKKFYEGKREGGKAPIVVYGETGTGAPLWDRPFPAAVSGISKGVCSDNILFSALLGSLCYFRLIEEAMAGKGSSVSEFVLAGGISSIDGVSRFLRDLLGKPVYRPRIPEMTGIGASLMGMVLGEGYKFPRKKNDYRLVKGRSPVDAAAYYSEWLELYHFARERTGS